MIGSSWRSLLLAFPAMAILSTGAVRSAAAGAFQSNFPVAPVNIDLNGQQCPHIFERQQSDGGLIVAWTCKTPGGPWPSALNFAELVGFISPSLPISVVSSNDGDIFAFYADNFQQVTVQRRLTNWAQVNLGNPAGGVADGPKAVAFTEGGIRKVAVFILASYQSTYQLWMKVFHGDTGAFDADWTPLLYPGTSAQGLLRLAQVNVTVESDGVNPANVSAWAVGTNGVLYENHGTVTGKRSWTPHSKSGQSISQLRAGTSSVFANGATKTSVTVETSGAQMLTYTHFNGSDAWFGPITSGYNPFGAHGINPSNNRDLPTSVFIHQTSTTSTDLWEESYDYLSGAGVTSRMLFSGLDNLNALPAGLFTETTGPEDVFILSNAGDLLLVTGGVLRNFRHP